MKKLTTKKSKSNGIPRTKTVSVLYQNIAGEIYAFAQVKGEIYFGKVPIKNSVSAKTVENKEIEVEEAA